MFLAVWRSALVGLLGFFAVGCAYQTVEPGHRGLRFEASGGLKHDVIQPGKHNLGWCFLRDCGRIDDFDVTYSTRKEQIRTASSEGLAMDLQLAVIYRPVVSELYQLDSEVGATYYDEVVGPEFRSAARGVFALHSYTELAVKNEKIENEIEQEVQRRILGKHVEVASVTLESINYAPEISNAVRARIVGEQEAARQKAAMENEALRQKLAIEQETARAQLKIQSTLAESKLQADLILAQKKNERAIAEEDALLEKAKAAASVAKARAEAESMIILAKAHAEENRAQTQALSPLTVQMSAYEALGKLGGTGTTIFLGDFSKAPPILLPPGLGIGGYTPYAPPRTAAGGAQSGGAAAPK
jgi:regulator of protease activity HflC (stomatin/prohibitin superfamily)